MRISRDEWAMKIALITAQRTTCCRRAVGCVLLNVRGHVLSTGYNGVAAGVTHCNEIEAVKIGRRYSIITTPGLFPHVQLVEHRPKYPHACSGATSPSGTNLDGCQAIHAEQNALLQCSDVHSIHTAYITASPCITCCKMLLNTSCHRIVYKDEYPQSDARDLWIRAGRSWEQLNVEL